MNKANTQLDFSHLQAKKRIHSAGENKENILRPLDQMNLVSSKFQTKELKELNLETESYPKSLFLQKQTQGEVIRESSGFARGEINLHDTFAELRNEMIATNSEKERLNETKYAYDSRLDNEQVNNFLISTNTEKERSLKEINNTNEERKKISQQKERISKLNSQKKQLKVEIEELSQELNIRILFATSRSKKQISQELQQNRIENEQTIHQLKLELIQKLKEYSKTRNEGLELIKSFKGQIKLNNNEKELTEVI